MFHAPVKHASGWLSIATLYAPQAGAIDIVIDGPLRGRQHLPNTIGLIKTHHTDYLPTEPLFAPFFGHFAPPSAPPCSLLTGCGQGTRGTCDYPALAAAHGQESCAMNAHPNSPGSERSQKSPHASCPGTRLRPTKTPVHHKTFQSPGWSANSATGSETKR